VLPPRSRRQARSFVKVTSAAVPDRAMRVLLLRGHNAAPWNLRMWEQLPDRFEVSVLLTSRNAYDLGDLGMERMGARSLRNLLPRGRLGDFAMGLTGDRYLAADEAFAAADIVHSEELNYWHSGDAARRKKGNRFRLVLTVWETLPLLSAFRNRWARVYRQRTLSQTDLFLPTTERARSALLLEGVPAELIEVSYPGVDVKRFSAAGRLAKPPGEHEILSPGRLVWEKGHQDVIRALAALRSGLVGSSSIRAPRLVIVGSGPEEARLREHASELGVGDRVEFRSVPYDEMPDLYARASCMVLASTSAAGCNRYLGDLPRCFWEEQFGMVLAEAIAAGLPIVASASGAIPEVAGATATYFAPGDWLALAQRLVEGPLANPPGQRVEHDAGAIRRYSTAAAAERLASAYDRLFVRASVRS
jgi:glycosyltransferase involved in cell wall biosynthesis